MLLTIRINLCRWATPKEQARNTSRNSFIEAFGKRQISADWAEETGLGRSTIEYRIKHGWPVEVALTTKVIKGSNQFTHKGVKVVIL